MGKVVLITGASAGIGKSTARQLLGEGYIVYGAARRVERMSDVEGLKVIKMDVTDDRSMKAGVDQIIAEEGRIDILINNAGYGSYGALEDVDIAEAKHQFEVNVFGLMRLTQLVLPHMRKEKSGTIINVSSIGGKMCLPMGGWYHATKYSVEALSDCLRLEVKPFGIDVIVIEPGGIKTEWDEIAMEGLLKTSGETAYSEIANKTAGLIKANYEDPKISDPQVIADLILKALKAKKPKTRYADGYMAKQYLFLRKILSDKAWDGMLEGYLR